MSDACCGPPGPGEPEAGPEKLWQIRELQLAVVAAVLLATGWALGRAGYPGVAVAAELAAVGAGVVNFAPDAVRNLRGGRIGVGTLMTRCRHQERRAHPMLRPKRRPRIGFDPQNGRPKPVAFEIHGATED